MRSVIAAIRAAERRGDPIGRHIGSGVYCYLSVYYAIGNGRPWRILD